MKIVKYIVVIAILILVAGAALTSCAAPSNVQSADKDLAGYTLKNKKEQMQQKILHKKNKTLIAKP